MDWRHSCPATNMPLKTDSDSPTRRYSELKQIADPLQQQQQYKQQSPPANGTTKTMPERNRSNANAGEIVTTSAPDATTKLDLILSPTNGLALSHTNQAIVASHPVAKCQQQLTELQEAAQVATTTGLHLFEAAGSVNSAGIRPTRKRYFILFMFFILQIVKSFQWICLASITNVVAKFYQVDNLAINWTTILFMVTFLVLALPVSWIMDSIGLRRSVLIGAVGVSLGIFIKCFSCHRDGFALCMWGHLIVGLCEPFFFSSYSQLASVWFPDNQVALATAISLIGEQTGLALGFIIPPLVIGSDPNDFPTIQRGLFGLFTMVALISILNTISIVLFFDEEPRLAPGIARYKQKQDETIRRHSLELELEKKKNKIRRRRSSTISRRLSQNVGEQVKLSAKIMQDKHFILLLAGFGICEGVCYSIHTLLNQMIVQPVSLIELPLMAVSDGLGGASSQTTLAPNPVNTTNTNSDQSEVVANAADISSWPGEDASLLVGHAGLILIVSGLLGSACCGYLLDKYHKHKQIALLIYMLNLVSMVALTGCLLLDSPLALYLATIPLGFSQLGYATCAFDFSVELTYPRPELVSSTLLNMSAQIFGIPISLAGSMIVDSLGSLALGGFFCLLLLIGLVIACLQGGELRRQNAVQARSGANDNLLAIPGLDKPTRELRA
uniref:Putative MFS-type transporter C09D4.1 n=1 Tax=Aceria tosichella TaxID=561515 RepID=A0A6G1SHF7_9ACAR